MIEKPINSLPMKPDLAMGETTGKDINIRIQNIAIDYQYKNLPTTMVSSIVVPLLTLLVMWSQVDKFVILVWTFSGIMIGIARYILFLAYNRAKKNNELGNPIRWGNYYAFTSLGMGILNGLAFLLFFSSDSFANQAFLLTIVVGFSAGATILNAYWLMSTYMLAIPTLGLAAIRLAMEGDITYIGLALLLIMFLLMLLKLANTTNKSVLETIYLQIENLDLSRSFQKQKELAEEANVSKSKFLAAASHDMRQPLHAMGLFVSLLKNELETDSQKVLYKNISNSLDSLRELLNTLLDVSKLDAGVVEKSIRHFCINKMIKMLTSEFKSEAEIKQLYFSSSSSDVVLRSDPALLVLILRNLISNAVRYTEEGGVTLKITEGKNNTVNISIIDTGIGIPEDRQEEVFQEFHQLGNPERDRTKGLGLGLSIVKRLTTLLQIPLAVKSVVGKGSTFTITIPRGEPGAIEEISEDDSVIKHVSLDGVAVIFIDDEEQIRKGMKTTLEEWGCNVLIAGSEEEALNVLKQYGQAPAAIIADYRLRENKTGAQSIESIRKFFNQEIPALIITGDTAPERIREARASGHAILHKPVRPAQILSFIRHAHRDAAKS